MFAASHGGRVGTRTTHHTSVRAMSSRTAVDFTESGFPFDVVNGPDAEPSTEAYEGWLKNSSSRCTSSMEGPPPSSIT